MRAGVSLVSVAVIINKELWGIGLIWLTIPGQEQ